MNDKRTPITLERIAELDKFQQGKDTELVIIGMRLGLISWETKITIRGKVRKLKSDLRHDKK